MQKVRRFNLEAVKEQIEKAMMCTLASRICGDRAPKPGAPVCGPSSCSRLADADRKARTSAVLARNGHAYGSRSVDVR